MCNCTTLPGPAQEIRQASPESDKPAHNLSLPDRKTAVRRTKKIALDPAESSAIYDAPLMLA